MSALIAASVVVVLIYLGLRHRRITATTNARPLADRIDDLLPQTQCTQCGYAACRPYAEAIAQGAADINHCPPGGDVGVRARICAALHRNPSTRQTVPRNKGRPWRSSTNRSASAVRSAYRPAQWTRSSAQANSCTPSSRTSARAANSALRPVQSIAYAWCPSSTATHPPLHPRFFTGFCPCPHDVRPRRRRPTTHVAVTNSACSVSRATRRSVPRDWRRSSVAPHRRMMTLLKWHPRLMRSVPPSNGRAPNAQRGRRCLPSHRLDTARNANDAEKTPAHVRTLQGGESPSHDGAQLHEPVRTARCGYSFVAVHRQRGQQGH